MFTFINIPPDQLVSCPAPARSTSTYRRALARDYMYNTTGRLTWFACQCKYNSVQWSIQELTPRIVATPLISSEKETGSF